MRHLGPVLLLALTASSTLAQTMRVTINDLAVDRPVLALPVLPGAVLDIAALGEDHGLVDVSVDGSPLPLPDGRGELLAPHETGVHRLSFSSGDERIDVNLLVVIPASNVVDGRLNGYRIDAYPSKPLRGLRVYEPPTGFVEVTADNRHTGISTSYALGEFVSKQTGGYPKYLVLRPRLLLKLELIGDALRAHGLQFEKFTIMSGYRTPYYNRSIGNVQYSRHLWGGAADIYIDESPRDGVIDDLNGDGEISRADARWLWQFIDGMARRGEFGELVGGLGLYRATAAHGPFVHVDVRGFVARW
jgi:hypothetical protein